MGEPVCRACRGQAGHLVLDLGEQPACDYFPRCDDPGPDPVYPLQMWLCSSCGLAQLVADPTVPEEPRGAEPAALVAQAADAVGRAAAAGFLPDGGRVAEYGSPHGGSWLGLLAGRGLPPPIAIHLDVPAGVLVARITAFVVGAVAIGIAILLGPTFNVAFLVGLAFAVAASANLPVIVLSIFWKRFTTAGAVWGLATGLIASLALIVMSPSIMGLDGKHLIHAAPLFPLENPGIISIPLGFVGAILGTLLSHEPTSEHKFNELLVRSNTGLGAEKAVAAH